MLESLRKAKSNVILQMVIVVIVLSFVFFIGLSGLGTDTVVEVVSINGERVTDSQFNARLRNQIENYRQVTGKTVPPEMEQMLRDQVRDGLIEDTVLRQEAKKIGITISDRELLQTIADIPGLRDENGKFKRDLYKNILESRPGFERKIRQDMLSQKMRQIVMDAVEVSDTELKGIFLEEAAQVNLEFVRVSQFTFEAKTNVGAPEIKAAIKDRMDEIQARYDRDKARKYDVPKKVRARHILKSFPKDADEAKLAEIKTEMEAILVEVQADPSSEAFAAIATAKSEDPGSAARGGDLGYFDKKRMVPEFADVAFSLNPGEVSGLVKSNFGYHIIRVEAIQEPKLIPIEDAQNDIAKNILKKDAAADAAKAYAAKIQTAWTSGEDTTELLAENSLTIQETGLFPRSSGRIPTLGAGSDVLSIAFDLGSSAPFPSEPVTIPGGFAILKLKEKKAADMADFDSEKSDLRDQSMAAKQRKLLDAYIDQAKKDSQIIPGAGWELM